LYEAVQILGAEPARQIEWIGVAEHDELGLDFGDAYLLVRTLQSDGVVFSSEALAILREIDDQVSEMSGEDNSHLWTFDALHESDRWARVRSLARRVLVRFPRPP